MTPAQLVARRRSHARGFSLIELLIVTALIGIIATLVVPQLLRAFERSRQRRSLADMRAIVGASAAYHVDFGEFPQALAELETEYLNPAPPADGWGNPWVYERASANVYTLTSGGQDGADGPAPPDPWYDEPFEADLVVTSGTFTQHPTSGR